MGPLLLTELDLPRRDSKGRRIIITITINMTIIMMNTIIGCITTVIITMIMMKRTWLRAPLSGYV